MILLWLLACVHVPAWQRDLLMSPCMQVPQDPLEASMDAHVLDTREALQTAAGGGASCGCD